MFMKQGNLEKWTDSKSCENLLFFSELVNELLFDYSIPSNRVATLNTHFLCIDAINAISGIDENGVPEGTLKPIVEELYMALKVDPVFYNHPNSPLNYFIKSERNGYRIVENISDLNYKELKTTVKSIYKLFFSDNRYYNELKNSIITIVKNNQSTQQLELFRLVKSLLTELINIGYSSQYIYYVMNCCFWKSNHIIDNPILIEQFFNEFTMEQKEYKVVFIMDKTKIHNHLQSSDTIKISESFELRSCTHKEKRFLKIKKHQAFVAVSIQSYDYYSAAENARYLLSLNNSIYRLYNHDYRYNIYTVKCGVYENETFYIISAPKSAVSHKKLPSDKSIRESIAISEKAIKEAFRTDYLELPYTLIKAVNFHSHAMDSISKENQLLDFWAIFESVLNISNEHTSDRIHQICTYLVPILKRRYIYSLFDQLASDIKTFSENEYRSIIGDAQKQKK